MTPELKKLAEKLAKDDKEIASCLDEDGYVNKDLIDVFALDELFLAGALNETIHRAVSLQSRIETLKEIIGDLNGLRADPLHIYAGLSADYKHWQEKAEKELAELLKGEGA